MLWIWLDNTDLSPRLTPTYLNYVGIPSYYFYRFSVSQQSPVAVNYRRSHCLPRRIYRRASLHVPIERTIWLYFFLFLHSSSYWSSHHLHSNWESFTFWDFSILSCYIWVLFVVIGQSFPGPRNRPLCHLVHCSYYGTPTRSKYTYFTGTQYRGLLAIFLLIDSWPTVTLKNRSARFDGRCSGLRSRSTITHRVLISESAYSQAQKGRGLPPSTPARTDARAGACENNL